MRHRVFRFLALLVTLVLTISGLAPVAMSSASAQSGDLTTWENETYGFTVGWTDAWAVDADEVAGVVTGGDVLRLTTGSASLTLRAEAADVEPAERLQYELDKVAYLNGNEAEITEDSDGVASAEWRSDSLSRLVSVRSLESGEALVIVTLVAEAAGFDDAVSSAGENITIDDVSLLGGEIVEEEPTEETEEDPTEEPTDVPEEEETPDIKLPTQEPLGEGVDGNSYSSPNFGYSLEWDSSWEVAEDGDITEDGYDVLQLNGEFGGLTIYAFEDYDGDPAVCLEGEADFNASDSAIEDWEPAENADGDPIAGESDGTAFGVYTATLLDPENDNAPPRNLAIYLECRSIGDGVILGISAFSLKNLYNDHIDEVLKVTDTITLYGAEGIPDSDSDSAETPEDIGNEGEDASEAPGLSPEETATPEPTEETEEVDSGADDGNGESAIDGSLFTSPGFGFTLDIPATWSVEDESIEEGNEQLVLSNGTSTVTVWATSDFGDDGLTGCVTFASEASGLDLELDVRNDGTAFQGSDDLAAYSAFVYDDDGTERTYFVKCSWIEEDESALIIVQDVASEDYASERRARRQIENSIELP